MGVERGQEKKTCNITSMQRIVDERKTRGTRGGGRKKETSTSGVLSFAFVAYTRETLPSYLEHDYVLDDSYFNFLFAN